MNDVSALLALAVAMAFGLLFNRFAKKAGMPNVTGYIVAGLCIGPSLWKLIPGSFDGLLSEETLSSFGVISTLALGFIAFSIGGEFKWKHLKELGIGAITITLFESLVAVFAVFFAVFLMTLLGVPGADLPTALTLGAIAAATAPAATLMVVRQYKAKGPVSSMLLPVVALDDAVALLSFSIAFSIAGMLASGKAVTVSAMLLTPLCEIGLSVLGGAVLGFLLCFVLRFFHSHQNKLMLTLAAVTLGVALADRFGLSALLLCMVASAVTANFSAEAEKLFGYLDDWTPPVFMLFFVISGAQLRLEMIPRIGFVGAAYLLVRSAGKYFGAGIGARLAKAHPNVARYLGFTLLPQAGVAIGLATTVMNTPGFEAYAPKIQAIILCATLVYELFGPLVTKAALKRAGEIQK